MLLGLAGGLFHRPAITLARCNRVAKQPEKPAPKQPVKIPDNWGQMNAAEKLEWRKKNQGYKPPVKAPSLSTPAPVAAAAPKPQEPAPEAEGYEESADGAQEQPNAEQIADDVAHQLSNYDARCLVGKILRAVADALDAGTGVE